MICDVSDLEATQQAEQEIELPRPLKTRWPSRPSPWFWGLVVLLVIAGIVATQVPRLSAILSAHSAKPHRAASTAPPALSGPAYTQAKVAGRNFVRANLRGARLVRLDLLGKSFRHADASGAVFTGSLLNGANFSHADLRGADLRGTCLRGAKFTGANLTGADFTSADVTDATVSPTATSRAIGWGSSPASSVCLHG